MGRLPRASIVDSLCEKLGTSWTDLALSGGEDYELLFTIAPKKWEKTPAFRGLRLSVIGELNENVSIMTHSDGSPLDAPGFRHLS